MREHLTFPGLQDSVKEVTFSLTPFTILTHELHDLGLRSAEDETLRVQERNSDPTNGMVDSIKKPVTEPLGLSHP